MIRIAGALTALLMVTAAGAACGSDSGGDAASPGPAALTQEDDGAGAVTVEATWVTPDHLATDEDVRAVAASYDGESVVLLHVKLNTHSVDVSKYDLAELATLDAGAGPQQPLGWTSISDDSHHVEGVLAFARPASSATAALVVRDVAGIDERRLVWTAAP